jgi:F-type H+-transporting ATPase subunit b
MPVASNALIQVVPGLMIWTVVSFGITFYVLKRVAFGPIQKIIDERRDRIRQSIEEADNAREEARRLLEEHRALIGQARTDAEEILSEARRVAESQRERVREETEADRQRRLEETRRQVEAETRRALEQIRAEVADLTLIAATKVTGKALSDADHKRLIEDAIRELDFSALEGSSS